MLDVLPSFSFGEAVYGGKTFAERVTGRFYTPDALAADLADQMIQALPASTSTRIMDVADPFCGDGRLIAALLARAADESQFDRSSWRIALWDRDANAITIARQRVAEVVAHLGLQASIVTQIGDSFAATRCGQFDLVVTNPPWELLKPDHRELAHFSVTEREQYRQRLRQKSDELDAKFPDAKGAGAWGGWATNLARCGWDLSMQLLKSEGILGIVLPSSLFADQASEQLRRVAFTRYRLIDMATYPPEARLFDRVDQPVVSATFSTRTASDRPARLRVFDKTKRLKSVVEIGSQSSLANDGYTIATGFGASAGEVLDLMRPLPKLAQFEGSGANQLWLGRELDETRVSEKLTEGSDFPFIKGRMVNRHAVTEVPSRSVRRDLARRFDSVSRPRAVWRDVSRSSQKRRMIGAVIPPGWVAGNSLHVGCFGDGNLQRTHALHAILSSFVLEFQVRCRLATGHMSLGVVRSAHVPELDRRLAEQLGQAALLMDASDALATDRLEVLVAQAYGLERDAFALLLENFEKVTGDEKERLLDKRLWMNAYRA